MIATVATDKSDRGRRETGARIPKGGQLLQQFARFVI